MLKEKHSEGGCMKYKIKEYGYLTAGALISAFAVSFFLAPNKVAPGGASGLGTILLNALGIPVSATVLAVNLVLFAIGRKRFGRRTIYMTLAATVLMSAFIQIFSFLKPVTDDLLLSSALGGALLGVGSGLTIASGASTGGTDFLAVILNGVFQHIPVADFIFAVDLIITAASGVVFRDYSVLLYGLFALYISTRFVDKVINGFRFARLVYVVSDKSDEIGAKVLGELDMGVTALYGRGMYSGREQKILMCVMRRNDFPRFRRAVETADKNAFIILSEANEVLGEGFNK